MALALNNLKRVDMPLSKETKPKIVDYYNYKSSITMPWKRDENILRLYLFEDKMIQNYASKISQGVKL